MAGIRPSFVAVLCAALGACERGGPVSPDRAAGSEPAVPEHRADGNRGQEHRAGGGAAEPGRVSSGFVPASTARRVRAIGSTVMLSETLRRAFAPTADFELLDSPQPGEWLAEHYERGQTYDEFVAYRSNRPDDKRATIYLLPMTADGGGLSIPMRALADFARAYFGLRTDVLPVTRLGELEVGSRSTGSATQYLTADILRLLEDRLPDDAYALLAITDSDLYAAPDWNHVFGHASLRGRVGVMSLARFDPAFFGVEMGSDVARVIILRRALTVLAHELGHVFGLKHCIFYRCVMGGAHDLRELDGAPLHTCPVCLRKLQKISGFDPQERYRRLARLLRRVGLEVEADWTEARRRFVAGDIE